MSLGTSPLGAAPTGAVLVFVDGVTIYRPASDISVAGWTATGAATVFGAINEVTPSDTEYATSPVSPAPATLGLSATMSAGSYNVRIRAALVSASGQVRVRFLNDSNVDVGGTDWQTVTSTPTTYVLPATITGTATRQRIEVQ